jgi:hypothetical protein
MAKKRLIHSERSDLIEKAREAMLSATLSQVRAPHSALDIPAGQSATANGIALCLQEYQSWSLRAQRVLRGQKRLRGLLDL